MRYPKEAIVFRFHIQWNDHWHLQLFQPLSDQYERWMGFPIWHTAGVHKAWIESFDDDVEPLTPAAREFLKAAKAGR